MSSNSTAGKDFEKCVASLYDPPAEEKSKEPEKAQDEKKEDSKKDK